MAFLANRVLIIGAGLIGGSLAKALRQRGLVKSVAGYGRRKEQLLKGIELGVLDEVVDDLALAVSEADIIVLGVPTLTVKEYLPVIQQHKKVDAVVTDVASVKGEIAHMIVQLFGEVPSWFVLGHPIAGSEKSGITASNENLFVNHKVILTPNYLTDKNALQLITTMWQEVGASVESMSVEQHDAVLAATSHLPHALAFTLVEALSNLDVNVDVFRFAAGGFRDFTRIASSHPVMWHDIMLANKVAILDVMAHFKTTLNQLELAIENDDGEAILAMFERAKTARDQYSELLLNRQKEE
jgi:3-phosphoshikimate 1-carboxyvinyltransferase